MSKRNRIKNNPDRKLKNQGSGYTLSSYDPVVVEVPLIEITEEEVTQQMHETAEKFPEYVTVDNRKIHPDDTLIVSMKTVSGGVAVGNLTYEDRRISLADEYIPSGLKEHLLLMRPGETKTVDYDAPRPQLDKADDPVMIPVTSEVSVHEIQKPTVPEITDLWVAKYIPGADTVEEFRDRVRRQMESKATSYTEDMLYSQCAAILAARLVGPIPDELFERGMQSSKQEFEKMLQQTGMTKEEYLQRQGMSENDLSFQFMAKGRQMITEGMALEAMADHLGLIVEEGDIDAVFTGATPQQIENMKQSYERAGKGEELRRMAYCGKALEHVVAHAQITRKKVSENINPFGSPSSN